MQRASGQSGTHTAHLGRSGIKDKFVSLDLYHLRNIIYFQNVVAKRKQKKPYMETNVTFLKIRFISILGIISKNDECLFKPAVPVCLQKRMFSGISP